MRSRQVEIRRATVADEAAILALARRALGWTDDPRTAELFRWKHDRNPFGPSPRWVAVDGDRIVGFRTFLRWRFRRGDETVEAVRAVDTATDPSHQGRGIFRSLTMHAVEELTADGVAFVFNTPNDQSRPGYLKMGWSVLGTPPVGVLPRLRSLPTIGRARTPADRWSEPTTVGEPAPDALAGWIRSSEASARVNDPEAQPLRWSTDRTPEFLQWRYGLEALHYRALPTAGDADVGLAVFRLRRRGPALEATVADILGPSNGAAIPAADRRRGLRRILRETGADYVLVATDQIVDTTPVLAIPGLGPRVTVRRLVGQPPASLADVRFSVGDLELL